MSLSRGVPPLPALFLLAMLHRANTLSSEIVAQTAPATPPEEATQTAPASPDEEPFLLPEPEPAIPDEYIQGRGYLGRFPDAWNTAQLLDPTGAKVFLALQDGATRESLRKVEVPDVDKVLKELIAGRIVRESGGTLRPAFPLIRGQARETFKETVQSAADLVYPSLRPSLKKLQRAARKEKVLPWLYTLVWSEVLESGSAEQTLVDAGALDPSRLRNEGYLWVLIPNDPFLTGVERYSTGRETLSYVWSVVAYPDGTIRDPDVQRRILDRALDRKPWDLAETEDVVSESGILDGAKRVKIPLLNKRSKLLPALRRASRSYVQSLLRTLKPDPLARLLNVTRDEAFAVGYACVGFRVLERAHREGLVLRPDFLANGEAPPEGLATTLVATDDEYPDPLERAYYLYDRQEFVEAVRQTDLFLKTHPGDPEAIFRKGSSLMKLKDYPAALATFEQALAQPAKPDDVWRGWLLVRAGNVLDLLKRREEAEKRYREALEFSIVAGSHETALGWLETPYQE